LIQTEPKDINASKTNLQIVPNDNSKYFELKYIKAQTKEYIIYLI